MPEFNNPVDIANRALQHVGSELISPTLGFQEQSKRAALCAFNYGKLRRAELQRNVWTFATRRTALRAIALDTMQLAATMWSASTTYFVGSIVVDANNTYWVSTIRDNLNNQPGVVYSAWDAYYGPLSVGLYNSQFTYFKQELVYTAAGNGSMNIFASKIDGNSIHPALPDQWSIYAEYFKDNVVQVFPAWSSLTTYAIGSTVQIPGVNGANATYYTSLVNSNLNNQPPNADWALMPVLILEPNPANLQFQYPFSFTAPNPVFAQAPLTTTPIGEWNNQVTYSLGVFVIFNAQVYVSLQNANTTNWPNAPSSAFWAAVTGGTSYMSLIDANIGNNPTAMPAAWSSVTTYSIGNTVSASDGFEYTSLTNSNTNNNPANNAAPTNWQQGSLIPWTTSFVQGGGNPLWTQVGGAAFPFGVGLTTISVPARGGTAPWFARRNAYRLPANYLRKCQQDPVSGANSWLGVPTNRQKDDWLIEGNFLLSMDGGPIVFRFISDAQDVQKFHDMFCECLAARLGLEICEPLNQSSAKLQTLGQIYKLYRGEAILQDGIEAGPEEPPLEDFVATRV